jgi:hypothetical protein
VERQLRVAQWLVERQLRVDEWLVERQLRVDEWHPYTRPFGCAKM